MPNCKNLFLRQAYCDNYETYKLALQSKAPNWDYIVLTASNQKQAESYRSQIQERLESDVLPKATKYIVVPDPEGKRIGSGGATLEVLRAISQQTGKVDFSGLKILCIHSGGDSKRIPQYSAKGKLFSSVPHFLSNDRCSTLFDEIIVGMSGVPSRINEGGMLVCSGDVLLLFNSLQLDFVNDDACAFTTKESKNIGQNHGVFIEREDGLISKCMQKKSPAELEACSAVDENGNVSIDTGAILLSSKILNALYGLVDNESKYNSLVNEKTRLSFYVDFLYPLSTDGSLNGFYLEKGEGEEAKELKQARTLLWNALSVFKIKLANFYPAAFIHFGTTKEFLDLTTVNIGDYKYLDWDRNVSSNYQGKDFSSYNSKISPKAKIGPNAYIENSEIGDNVSIGEGSIISGLALEDCEVPPHVVLHGLPLEDGMFVCRYYGVNDNPKSDQWMGDKLNTSLWEAKLFPARKTMNEAVSSSLQHNMDGSCLSLKESFEKSDCRKILEYEACLRKKIIQYNIVEALNLKTPESKIRSMYPLSALRTVWPNLIDRANSLSAKTLSDFSIKTRIYCYAAKLFEKSECLGKCYEAIREATLASIKPIPLGRIAKKEAIIVLPVRVNFAGGWTDTPPYCFEHGGAVLNAAIKLSGTAPIEVTVRKRKEPSILLSSTDIHVEKEFTDISEIRACENPSDPFALHKAALLMSGLIPLNGQNSIEKICRSIGGGLYINTRVIGIPKGSGLGTSSILAAACLKALYSIFGIAINEDDLCSQVLGMEQIMSTGGGWQDQVGGLSAGIKLITTNPGFGQKVTREYLRLSKEVIDELNSRFALIYTGQRRLARNLLREVVTKYILGNREITLALEKAKILTLEMRRRLESNDISSFAKLLNQHWELSKKIDAGCTNGCIDQILLSIDDLIDGKMICGAGGGGFLEVIMKPGVTKDMLSKRLQEVFGNAGVQLWESEFLYE